MQKKKKRRAPNDDESTWAITQKVLSAIIILKTVNYSWDWILSSMCRLQN